MYDKDSESDSEVEYESTDELTLKVQPIGYIIIELIQFVTYSV